MFDPKTYSLHPDFEFDEATHIYKLGGRRIPSVTQVLWDWELIGNFYINRYSGVKISKETFEYKGEIGNGVHKAYPLILNNTLDWGSLSPVLQGRCEQFKLWMDEYQPEIRMVERKLYCDKLWFCGTFDIFCRLGDKLYLIDVKTGERNDLQLTGYEYLIKANYPDLGHRKINKYFLLLNDDSHKFIPMENPKLNIKDFMAYHRVWTLNN